VLCALRLTTRCCAPCAATLPLSGTLQEALNGAGEVLAHLPAPARQVLPIQRAAAGVTLLFAQHIMQHGDEMQDVDGVLQLLTEFCRVAHYSRIIWHLFNPCRPAAAALQVWFAVGRVRGAQQVEVKGAGPESGADHHALCSAALLPCCCCCCQALEEQRQPLWWAVAGAPFCQHAAVVPEKHNAIDVASLVALLHDEQLLPPAPVDSRAVVAALHQLLQQYQPQILTQQQEGGGQQQQARQRPARRLHQQPEEDVADWLGGHGLELATVCAAANDTGIGTTIGTCSLCGCVAHKGMGRLIACTSCSHEYHAGCAKQESIFAPDLTALSSGGGEGVCLACQGFPPSHLFWTYQADAAGASQQLQQQRRQQQKQQKKKQQQQHPAAAAAAAAADGGGSGRGNGRRRGAAAAAAAAAAPPAVAEDGDAAVGGYAAQHSGDASAGSPARNTRTRQRQQHRRQPPAPSDSSSSEESSSTSEDSESGDEDDDASAQDAGASQQQQQQQQEVSSSQQDGAEEEPAAQHDYADAEFDYDEYYRGVAEHHGDDDGVGPGREGSDGEHQQQQEEEEEEQQEEEQLEEEQLEEGQEQQQHHQDVGSDDAHAAGSDSGSAGGGSGVAEHREQGSHDDGDGAEGENSCSSSSHGDDVADRAAAGQQQRQQHVLEHERGSQRQQQQEVLVGTQLFAGLDFVAASPSAGPAAAAAAAGGAADADEEEQQAAGLAAARAAAAGHRPVTRSRDAAAAAVLESPVSQGTRGTKHARQAGAGAHGAAAAAAAAAAVGGGSRGGHSTAAAAAAGRLSRAGAAAAAREAAAAAGAQQPVADPDAMDVEPAPPAPAAAAAGGGGFPAPPPFMPPLPSQDACSPARAARKRLHPTAAAGQAGSQGAADVPGSQEQEGGRQKRARGREDLAAAAPSHQQQQQEQLERLRAAQEQEQQQQQQQQQQQAMQQQQQHQAPLVITLAPAQHQEIRQERRRHCQEALLEQAAACATAAGVIALRRRAGVLYDARLLRHMVARLLSSVRPQQHERLLAWGMVVLFSTVVPGGDDGSAAAQAASRVLRGSTSFAEVCVAWPPTPPPAAAAAAAAAAGAGVEAPVGAASRQAAKAAVAAWDIAALCDPVLDGLLGVLQQQLAVDQQPVHLVPAAANDIGPAVLAAFTGLYHTQGPCAGLTAADADAEDPASLHARRELLLELLPSAHKLLAAIAQQAAADPAAGAQQGAAGAAGQEAAGQAAAAAGSPRSPGSPATGDVSLDAVPFAVPYTLACDAMARVAARLHDPHRSLQHISHLVRNVATAHARRSSELAALDSGVMGAVKPALLLAALQVDEAQPVLSLRRCVLVFGELLTEQVAAFGLPRDAHGQHLPDDLAAEMLLMLARASRCRLATELAAELITPGSPMTERKVAVETLLPRLQGMMQDAFALLPGDAAAAGEAQASPAAVTAFVKQLLRAGAAAFHLLLLEDRSLRNYLEPLRATCLCEGLASFALNVLNEFVAPEVADGNYGNATEGLAWLEQDCVEGMRTLGEQQRQERQRQREQQQEQEQQEQEGQQEQGQ
jgi:hypothetical protein